MKPSTLLAAWLFFLVSSLTAEQKKPDPSLLTVDRIYATGEFKSKPFAGRWLKDSSGFTTLEPSKDPPGGVDVVLHDPRTGKTKIIVPAAHLTPSGESAPLKVDDYAWSADRSLLLIYTNSKRVWRRNTRGDYWVLDLTSRELRKLGGDAKPSTLMFAKFSPTGRQVAFVRENNIYLEDLSENRVEPLTASRSDNLINGTFDWVYEEELSLRDGFAWSPDGKSIAYWQIDSSGVRKFPLVNRTDSLYPRVQWFAYPKAGEKNSACRVGVMDVESRETRWAKVPGDPRNHYIARMAWAENSEEIILQQLNRLQNTNRVMLADADSGEVKTILTERDKAWVNVHDELKWLDDGKRFTWISERDGWRHVYVCSRNGGKPHLATPGDYDVTQLLHVDEKGGWLYYMAAPRPTQRCLYRIGLNGGKRERLTPEDPRGTHDYRVSPDGRFAIHTYSRFGVPPTTDLISLPDHKRLRVLSDNKKLHERVARLKQGKREFFRVEIEPGIELDGWAINPPDPEPKKKYPLLIYVYGEPAGQTVLDRWGGQGYLWHLMLSQRGYLVMSLDNRGTPAPRGRAWRKCVYRKVGVLAPKDQAAALRAVMKRNPAIDPERIGIWGWSGGGSMSLNAIFKYPDLYKTAISVAPVSNQRFYDTIYQERYMGLPSDNVEGFRDGSSINFAHQLKGNLLLVHGTSDDNVHYQSTLALANELVRHNKQFSMMAYPNRTHSIRKGKNTSRHLRTLMTRYLLQHLPPGQ